MTFSVCTALLLSLTLPLCWRGRLDFESPIVRLKMGVLWFGVFQLCLISHFRFACMLRCSGCSGDVYPVRRVGTSTNVKCFAPRFVRRPVAGAVLVGRCCCFGVSGK